MAETWTPIDDPTAFQDDAVFEIDKATKSIQVLVEQPIVAGENKSQFIKFQMGRYYDAIDLTQMEVNILFESPTGYQDISSAVNREYSEEYIRFGWLVPSAACPVKGTLSFAVEFVGEDYVLKTTIGSTPVLDSIPGSSAVPEPVEKIWYIELQSQIAAAINNANSTLEAVTELVETFQGDIGEAISDWLTDHPEATTTVQDRSITDAKLTAELQKRVKNSRLRMSALNLENSSTTGLGDCTVFHGDANGIVDFGTDPNVQDLLAYLTTNNVTHIDFVIISHYHGDHVTTNFATALETLISGGIDFSDCVFYLPHAGIDWTEFVGTDNQSARETVVKTALTGAGLTWVEPTNGQSVSITPYTSITFYNIGDYDDYYDCFVDGRGNVVDYTIYNNFSMIAVLDHCGTKFLMSGDVHELAQAKNYQNIDRCDVYKVEHHGTNNIVDADWQARIVPKFVVAEQYSKTTYNTLDKLMPPIRKYCDRGAKLLFNGSGASTILSDGGELYQESGGCFDLSLVFHLSGGEPISAYADLDDYVGIGEYYCKQTMAAQTLLNCPVRAAFRLIVENTRGADSGDIVYRLQKLTAIASHTEYRRYVSVDSGVATFSEWVKADYIYDSIAIQSGADLNDCVELKEYYCLNNTTAGTLSHCPVTKAFRMVVENPRGADSGNTVYRLQKLTPISSNIEYIRYASITSGVATFGPWESIAGEAIHPTFNTSASDYYTTVGVDYIVKVGKLCIAKLEGTTGSATSGWTTIFTGCPPATIGQLTANLLTNSGTVVRSRVTTNGDWQISIPSASANKSIGTTFVYVCA